ncbi:MAG: hypothetical protein AAGF98_07445 [Cyanobacteria bacterium P01_H01_bin.153]
MKDCHCMTPPFHYTHFDSQYLGVDETNGRYGDVSIETCKACGSKWIHYLVEYEAFSSSGRWYRALASAETLEMAIPQNAVDLLSASPWHFFGGSYFHSTGQRGTGPINVDL